MEVEIKMPDLSTTGDEVTVLNWLVEVGQPIKRGQALFEVETDKATMEVESVKSGVLKKQIAQPDDAVSAGAVIAILEVKGPVQDSGKSGPSKESPKHKQTTCNESTSQSAVPSNVPPQADSSAQATTGMFAKNRQAAQRSAVDEDTTIPMSGTQQAVGRRMQQSKQTIPHFYLQTSVNAEPMISQRVLADGGKVAWDAFFVCAVAKSLKKFPRMSCRFKDEQIISLPTGVVGVAVDVDGDLYVVPVVDAASNTPEQTSSVIRKAAGSLRAGDSEFKKLHAADITITNLGIANVESFLPIINPPEASILGISKMEPRVTVLDGEIAIQNRVSLSLAVDHRIVNGRYAADFLGNLVEEIESF
ncbi:MAG: hypothetical protein GXP26_04335 [Planctomycetes bacterium]|nr:hypothetical protein [Planctomycetota bacterium]